MTLIVGIKCRDGIVLGADGAATYGSTGRSTIRQPVRRKLTIHEECVVIGVSGPVGLGQKYCGEIGKLWDQKAFSSKKPFEAMSHLSEAMRRHLAPEYQAAAMAQPILGGMAAQSVLSAAVVALPVSKEPCLFQFDEQGASEQATDDLPFVAVGSGQGTADPFLAFLRRIFWPDQLPPVGEGIFAALWTLKHAIETSPGGIADPKQIVVLQQSSGRLRAVELPEDDLNEHLQAIALAEQTLAEFRSLLKVGDRSTVAEPPEP